jgi:DNA polymerase-3 subunit gamma/tau
MHSQVVPTAELADRWEGLVRALIESGQISGLARELAWQSSLTSVSSEKAPVWSLTVEHDSLRIESVVQTLTLAMSSHLGSPVQLQVSLGATTDTPAQREAKRRQLRLQQAQALLADDKQVQALLGQFKTARIVPGSIKPGVIETGLDLKKGKTS